MKKRKDLIEKAFDHIDKDGSGEIEAHEVAKAFDSTKHPEVIIGTKTAQEILDEFLKTFDIGAIVDGAVTLHEFINYYHNVSAGIGNDDYFELLIRNTWGLAGDSSAAAKHRLVVTDVGGNKSVVEVAGDPR
jgi:hypothetical protein